MLAYVFWHWKRPGVRADAYEALQRAFQQALNAAPPPGLGGSATFAIRGAAWAAGGDDAYEDWYYVRASADLDPLNDAAVSASRQVPHDTVAAAAAGGTAGLYRLRGGDGPIAARHAWWFAKPAEMRYPELLAALAPLCTGGRGALWCRQMTLGPALEFCLHTLEPMALPPGLSGQHFDLRTVYPEPA